MLFKKQILRDASDELLNIHKVSIDSLYKDGWPGIWAKFSAEYQKMIHSSRFYFVSFIRTLQVAFFVYNIRLHVRVALKSQYLFVIDGKPFSAKQILAVLSVTLECLGHHTTMPHPLSRFIRISQIRPFLSEASFGLQVLLLPASVRPSITKFIRAITPHQVWTIGVKNLGWDPCVLGVMDFDPQGQI